MNILIVDDEQLARQRLHDLLEDIGVEANIQEAENGLACVTTAQETQQDIILLDIRMPGMDGLEAALHLARLSPAPAIIFTTAYDDHAIDAFDANAVDYLLKPIRKARLSEALEKANFISHARLSAAMGEMDSASSTARTHLSASYQGNIELIPIEDIQYLKADHKYVTVCWSGRESLIDESLKNIEKEFGERFIRVHRNALVAPAHIAGLEKDKEGKVHLRLRDNAEQIDVSRRHLPDVRQVLKDHD